MAHPATHPARTKAPTPRSGQRPSDEPAVFLEAGQLTAATRRPVPRAQLGRRAMIALWALRVLVIILCAMVIYTFVAQLGN
jgi:hypothetical protein